MLHTAAYTIVKSRRGPGVVVGACEPQHCGRLRHGGCKLNLVT